MNISELAGLLVEWQEARSAIPPSRCAFGDWERIFKWYENAEDALVKFVAENFEDLEQLQ